jgi:uncharacterized DUF497 family protein
MEFEFDPSKSVSNKEKHGIDFVEAQALWDDPDRFEVPARTDQEERLLLIGRIGREHWSAVFTRRADKTRIISARRARTEEVEAYES